MKIRGGKKTLVGGAGVIRVGELGAVG